MCVQRCCDGRRILRIYEIQYTILSLQVQCDADTLKIAGKQWRQQYLRQELFFSSTLLHTTPSILSTCLFQPLISFGWWTTISSAMSSLTNYVISNVENSRDSAPTLYRVFRVPKCNSSKEEKGTMLMLLQSIWITSSSLSYNHFLNCLCFTMQSCLLPVSREHISSVYQSPFIPAKQWHEHTGYIYTRRPQMSWSFETQGSL